MTREKAIKLALEAGFTLDNAWFNISHIEKLIDLVKAQRVAQEINNDRKEVHEAVCLSPTASVVAWVERWKGTNNV